MRIKLFLISAILLLCCSPALAKKRHAKAAPVVDQALQLRLWRAQAQFDAAELALVNSPLQKRVEATQKGLQEAMTAWQSACGGGFQPKVIGGNPGCVAAPKAARDAHPQPKK